MPCTDDDLKRAKENINDPYVQALLARLEAAEKVCDAWGDSAGGTITQEAWNAWRKACGK